MKIAVLGGNTVLGRKIVLDAERAGINVTLIVNSPSDLVGNGPVIIKTADELTRPELAGFHALVDAVSIPLLYKFPSDDSLPLWHLHRLLAGTSVHYIGIGSVFMLWTDSSRTQLVADSDLSSLVHGSDRAQRCKAILQQMQAWQDFTWTLLCPPLATDEKGYGTGKVQLGDDVLPVGMDGSSHITLTDFSRAVIEYLKVRRPVQQCVSVRSLSR